MLKQKYLTVSVSILRSKSPKQIYLSITFQHISIVPLPAQGHSQAFVFILSPEATSVGNISEERIECSQALSYYCLGVASYAWQSI